MRKAPAEEERNERARQADESCFASTETIAENSENRTEQGTTKKGDRHKQALLCGAQVQLLAEKRSERSQKHPDHEADVKVQECRDERWEVAGLEKLLRDHCTLQKV